MTVCCASDGNYGYALSWAARRFGCEAVVFVPDACSEARQSSIGEEGARVIRIPGTYEDAHKEAIRCSLENHWVLVSDTAFDGYEHIPRQIMEA